MAIRLEKRFKLPMLPLKARAYLDIRARGEDSKNWKKHRRDIINLAVNLLTKEQRIPLKGKIQRDFFEFMTQFKQEITAEIIYGACNQKLNPISVVSLLEAVFLEKE